MVQFLITVHKKFKDRFCEVWKIRLVFNMSRNHIPEAASQYWDLSLPFESGADRV